jgi:hypothetical protein
MLQSPSRQRRANLAQNLRSGAIALMATLSLCTIAPGDAYTQCRANATSIQPDAVLADQYAPTLVIPDDEPNLPTSVGWFISRTRLSVHDGGCNPNDVDFGPASFGLLATATYRSPCDNHLIAASGTRNASKNRTFVLSDLDRASQAGTRDTQYWVTYYHAFKNLLGGTTIQYWFFYPFNTGTTVLGLTLGSHGGDWEMAEVVLDVNNQPVTVRATGHTQLQDLGWSALKKNGNHVTLFTEKGGHEIHGDPQEHPPYIIRMTWAHSKVLLPRSPPQNPGPLIDLGTKLHPLVPFLQYSGLWGSLGATSISSGYWGPVFNETGMTSTFLAAWCDGIAKPDNTESGRRECYPDDSL